MTRLTLCGIVVIPNLQPHLTSTPESTATTPHDHHRCPQLIETKWADNEDISLALDPINKNAEIRRQRKLKLLTHTHASIRSRTASMKQSAQFAPPPPTARTVRTPTPFFPAFTLSPPTQISRPSLLLPTRPPPISLIQPLHTLLQHRIIPAHVSVAFHMPISRISFLSHSYTLSFHVSTSPHAGGRTFTHR